MNNIDRTDPQTIFDAHVMSKLAFCEIYQLKSSLNGGPKASVQELSNLYHELSKLPKPTDIKRTTTVESLQQKWVKPGSAADPNRREDVGTSAKQAKIKKPTVEKELVKAISKQSVQAVSKSPTQPSRKEQIKELMDQGITSAKEIAEKIGAHPSYVSTIMKKING